MFFLGDFFFLSILDKTCQFAWCKSPIRAPPVNPTMIKKSDRPCLFFCRGFFLFVALSLSLSSFFLFLQKLLSATTAEAAGAAGHRGAREKEKKITLTIGAFSTGRDALSSSVLTVGLEKCAKGRRRQTITDICHWL